MSDVGPYGPLVPLGRRGPLRAVGLRVLLSAGAAGAVLLLTGSGCRTQDFGPGSGDGRDPSRPLLVDAPAALVAAADCTDRHLRQVADLPAPNPWVPLGSGPAGPFTGSYDGGGHRLTGLRVFLPGSDDVGAFGILEGAEVRDLVLEDVIVQGRDRIGAVAGRLTAGSRIVDVTVRDATVEGAADVGGLTGLADPMADVSGTFVGTVRSGPVTTADAPAVGRVGPPGAPSGSG